MEIREKMTAKEVIEARKTGCVVVEYMAGKDKRYMIIYPPTSDRGKEK